MTPDIRPTIGKSDWFVHDRFGMFIHWGLYAVPAGDFEGHRSKEIGEWIMSWANIPRARYEKFAARFNPAAFLPYSRIARPTLGRSRERRSGSCRTGGCCPAASRWRRT